MNLDIFTNKMRMAFQTPRITDIMPKDLTDFASAQIIQCYIMVGYLTYNEKDISVLAAKLCSDLRESYPYLHRGEVVICFELGAKGEYGDYSGVNLRTFRQAMIKLKAQEWLLKQYFNSLVRLPFES